VLEWPDVQSSLRPRIAAPQVHSSKFTVHSPHSTTYRNTLMLDCHAILIEHVPPRRSPAMIDAFVSSWAAQWILAMMPLSHHSTPKAETPQHSQMWRLHSPVAFSPNSFIRIPRPSSLDNAFKGISRLRVRKLASSSPPVRGAWPMATNHWSNSCSW
jgi:hypothetical protein